MKYAKTLLLLFALASCNSREQRIKSQLKSNETVKIIQACNDLKTIDDTIFVASLLENPYDIRITNDLRYKGIPVYQVKMNALQRISGLNPPNRINYKLDSVNVEFYLDWAKERRFIN